MFQVQTTILTNFISQVQSRLFTKAEQKIDNAAPSPIQTSEEETKTKSLPKRTYQGLINDRPHCTLFLGKKASGKTTLLLNLLLTIGGWFKVYNQGIFISSTLRDQYEKVWSKINKQGLTVYDQLSDGLLTHLMDIARKTNESMLIISDDMCSQWRKNN